MSFYQKWLSIASIVFVYISKGIMHATAGRHVHWSHHSAWEPRVVFFSYIQFDHVLSVFIANMFMDPMVCIMVWFIWSVAFQN